MRGRGKQVAMWAAGLGLVVLIATGIALKDWIREEYWIWCLRHGDEVEKKVAAESLAAMASIKAIPALVAEMSSVARRHCNTIRRGSLWSGPRPPTPAEEEELLRSLERRLEDMEWAENWPGQALAKIGKPTIPALLGVLRNPRVFRKAERNAQNHLRHADIDWCRETLARMGQDAVPALEKARGEGNLELRWFATEALNKIRSDADDAPPR